MVKGKKEERREGSLSIIRSWIDEERKGISV